MGETEAEKNSSAESSKKKPSLGAKLGEGTPTNFSS
jgi:hypothetical protein